ncbi:MAG TPA: hypothetical protein PK520_02460 [Exilispira sp.]|nr:hypothetical protein [Exilispira sp.]HQQ18930.1 hypothetical protein [Exilispira sp.]
MSNNRNRFIYMLKKRNQKNKNQNIDRHIKSFRSKDFVKFVKFFLVIILFICLCSSDSIYTRFLKEGSELNWVNIYSITNLKQITWQNKVAYKIKENEKNIDDFTDLIIHFNEVKKTGFSIIGNYKVIESSYLPNIENKVYGEASANFSLSHHRIKLLPDDNSIFTPGKSIKSFTISCWLYPQSSYEGNEIFSYYGPSYNKVTDQIEFTGFKVFLLANKIVLKFDNLFYLQDSPISFEINTGIELDIARWQHIAITYNHNNGELICYKNNRKTSITWLTDSSKENGTLLNAKIPYELRTYLIVGANYIGNIDEFVIEKKVEDEFDLSLYSKYGGEMVSKLIDLEYYSSDIINIELSSILEKQTILSVYYRISEDFFNISDMVIPWKKYSRDSIIQGRYIQWKIKFFPSYDGSFSPQLNDIIITYIPNLPPAPPKELKYELMENSQVKISWRKNLETDLYGYYVYYGYKSGFYINNDALEGKSPVFTTENYIILTLKPETEYFVAIKAADKAAYHQKSQFSEEIVFRTF